VRTSVASVSLGSSSKDAAPKGSSGRPAEMRRSIKSVCVCSVTARVLESAISLLGTASKERRYAPAITLAAQPCERSSSKSASTDLRSIEACAQGGTDSHGIEACAEVRTDSEADISSVVANARQRLQAASSPTLSQQVV